MMSPDLLLFAIPLAAVLFSLIRWSLGRATAKLSPPASPSSSRNAVDDLSWDAVDPDKIWRRAYRWDTL